MQIIKLYAGLTEEYEVVRTNAPKKLIEQQMARNNELNVNCENPYDLIEKYGFFIESICCQQDDIESSTLNIDYELDYYNYK